jgi:GTP pyrophosphokinase
LRGLKGFISEKKDVPEKKDKPRVKPSQGGVLIVGVDRLMTQLARCCKPLPPDPVRGFVTRGKGISVHREDCTSLQRLAERSPQRLIEAGWGKGREGEFYPVDVVVTASDRRGLLRDIGEALAHEKINVTGTRSQSRDDLATMRFTFEVANLAHLRRALATIRDVRGVIRVGRD